MTPPHKTITCSTNTFADRAPPKKNNHFYAAKLTVLLFYGASARLPLHKAITFAHRKTYTFADRGLAPFSVEFLGFEKPCQSLLII